MFRVLRITSRAAFSHMSIDADKGIPYGLTVSPNSRLMNAKLLLKTIFLLLVLLLLVLMGMNNLKSVSFSLPPLVKAIECKAAIMYFAFFAAGLLTGTVLTAGGGGKRSGGSGPSKPSAR